MKKIFRNILLMTIILSFRTIPTRRDITIKLKVHGTDEKMSDKILGDLINDLGNKPNMVIVSDKTDSSTFTITAQYASLRSGDKLIGIYVNALLTRRIRTAGDESGELLLKSSVFSIPNFSEIDKICSNLIEQYDVQYFEKERRESVK
jgi:hypothetical protein